MALGRAAFLENERGAPQQNVVECIDAIHWAITIAGVFIANKFMLSFELLVLFSTPVFVVLFGLNLYRYLNYKKAMDLALLGVWIMLALTNGAYLAYMLLGVTQALWMEGFWFSEDDVLHVLMMGWVLYIGRVVSAKVEDAVLPA